VKKILKWFDKHSRHYQLLQGCVMGRIRIVILFQLVGGRRLRKSKIKEKLTKMGMSLEGDRNLLILQ